MWQSKTPRSKEVYKEHSGNSLVIQWFGAPCFHWREHGFDPGHGTKIPQADQKKKRTEHHSTTTEYSLPSTHGTLSRWLDIKPQIKSPQEMALEIKK